MFFIKYLGNDCRIKRLKQAINKIFRGLMNECYMNCFIEFKKELLRKRTIV